MTSFEYADLLKAFVLFMIASLVASLFYRLNKGDDNNWRFVDMLVSKTKDGQLRADRQAFTHVGAFFMSSLWGTWLAYNHELTEWFFNGYMLAWAAAYLGNAIIKAKQATQPNQQTEDKS